MKGFFSLFSTCYLLPTCPQSLTLYPKSQTAKLQIADCAARPHCRLPLLSYSLCRTHCLVHDVQPIEAPAEIIYFTVHGFMTFSRRLSAH